MGPHTPSPKVGMKVVLREACAQTDTLGRWVKVLSIVGVQNAIVVIAPSIVGFQMGSNGNPRGTRSVDLSFPFLHRNRHSELFFVGKQFN